MHCQQDLRRVPSVLLDSKGQLSTIWCVTSLKYCCVKSDSVPEERGSDYLDSQYKIVVCHLCTELIRKASVSQCTNRTLSLTLYTGAFEKVKQQGTSLWPRCVGKKNDSRQYFKREKTANKTITNISKTD